MVIVFHEVAAESFLVCIANTQETNGHGLYYAHDIFVIHKHLTNYINSLYLLFRIRVIGSPRTKDLINEISLCYNFSCCIIVFRGGDRAYFAMQRLRMCSCGHDEH